MNDHERIAHHEAAHVVLAVRSGAGVLEQGINLDATTSMEGAYGNAAVNIFKPDPKSSMEQQKLDLIQSLSIIVAGAASDAKLMNRSLRDALRQQPGDEKNARKFLVEIDSPLIERNVEDKGLKEEEIVLDTALQFARKQLEIPIVWKTIQAVARASTRRSADYAIYWGVTADKCAF